MTPTQRPPIGKRALSLAVPLGLLIAFAVAPVEAAARTQTKKPAAESSRRPSGHVKHTKKKKPRWRETGEASYYGRECARRRTANGERFDPTQLTAAHRSLPFGSRVRVTNLGNGRRVVVRINDRGPYAKGRVVDLSHAAAHKLGFVHDGVTRVRLEVLKDNHSWRDPLADGTVTRKTKSGKGGKSAARPTTRRG